MLSTDQIKTEPKFDLSPASHQIIIVWLSVQSEPIDMLADKIFCQ